MAVFEPNGDQLSSPHTAAVQGEQVGKNLQAHRGPVATDDRRLRMPPVGDLKPWNQALRGLTRWALIREVHRAVSRANTQMCEHSGRRRKPCHAGQAVGPSGGSLLIQVMQKGLSFRTSEHLLHFLPQRNSLGDCPLWQEPGVHEHERALLIDQSLLPQPIK